MCNLVISCLSMKVQMVKFIIIKQLQCALVCWFLCGLTQMVAVYPLVLRLVKWDKALKNMMNNRRVTDSVIRVQRVNSS